MCTRMSEATSDAQVLVSSIFFMGFPGGLMVKNPPAMQEAQVLSLGWEDPLEKEMIAHSSILEIGRAHV